MKKRQPQSRRTISEEMLKGVPVIPVYYFDENEAPAWPLATWQFPHRDAEDFIESVITQTLTSVKRKENPDWEDDAADPLWDNPSDADEHMTPRKREEADRIQRANEEKHEAQYDPYEGKMREDVDGPEYEAEEGSKELTDRVRAAHSALARGNAEDLIREIEPILDVGEEELDADIEEIVVNWSLLLVDHSPAPAKKQAADADVRAKARMKISDLCETLCHLIAEDVAALREIEWRLLEQVIAHALEGLGFQTVLTPSSKDKGKDVIATCQLVGGTITYFVEIKHWRSGKKVGAKEIFDFVEVNASEQTQGGLFLSTSGFAENVISHLAELGRLHVDLGGEAKVATLFKHFVRHGRGLWSSLHTSTEILLEPGDE